MAADSSHIDHRVIAAFLDDVDFELEAVARLNVDPPSRFAAFHLQQAAEKLVKAVRLSRGLRTTADHDIERLIGELPLDDVWRTKLSVLEPLASYATSYRYPSTAGRLRFGISHDQAIIWIKSIAGLTAEARALVGTTVPRDGSKR
jgi:HEPN domain-containing protein